MALSVLIIDDSRDNADSLAELVRAWGYTASVAYDGEGGFSASREAAPDCVVLDINMPRQDGYALARQFRATPGFDRVRLVSLSANAGPEHDRKVQEAGFDYSLTKPAELRELRRILTMIDTIARLAEKTEGLARQNVELATQTKELLQEVRQDIQEVKRDVKELKEELREVKDKASGTDEGG